MHYYFTDTSFTGLRPVTLAGGSEKEFQPDLYDPRVAAAADLGTAEVARRIAEVGTAEDVEHLPPQCQRLRLCDWLPNIRCRIHGVGVSRCSMAFANQPAAMSFSPRIKWRLTSPAGAEVSGCAALATSHTVIIKRIDVRPSRHSTFHAAPKSVPALTRADIDAVFRSTEDSCAHNPIKSAPCLPNWSSRGLRESRGNGGSSRNGPGASACALRRSSLQAMA